MVELSELFDENINFSKMRKLPGENRYMFIEATSNRFFGHHLNIVQGTFCLCTNLDEQHFRSSHAILNTLPYYPCRERSRLIRIKRIFAGLAILQIERGLNGISAI